MRASTTEKGHNTHLPSAPAPGQNNAGSPEPGRLRQPCFLNRYRPSSHCIRIMLNEDVVIDALKGVKYPGYSRDIVSFGLVKDVAAGHGALSLVAHLPGGNPQI